jgi:hypothetical protein
LFLGAFQFEFDQLVISASTALSRVRDIESVGDLLPGVSVTIAADAPADICEDFFGGDVSFEELVEAAQTDAAFAPRKQREPCIVSSHRRPPEPQRPRSEHGRLVGAPDKSTSTEVVSGSSSSQGLMRSDM